MADTVKEKFKRALENLRLLKVEALAEAVQLQDYEAKDGSKISTDADGKVQGDVKDGDYELADGSTLTVADGVATVKPAEKKEEAAADAPGDKPADEAAPETDKPADEAKAEPTMADVLAGIQSLTAAITQALGLKDEALAAEKAKLAETQTKLAEAEQAVAEADKKAVDRKPSVGQGHTTNLGAETTKLKPWQLAQEQARAMR